MAHTAPNIAAVKGKHTVVIGRAGVGLLEKRIVSNIMEVLDPDATSSFFMQVESGCKMADDSVIPSDKDPALNMDMEDLVLPSRGQEGTGLPCVGTQEQNRAGLWAKADNILSVWAVTAWYQSPSLAPLSGSGANLNEDAESPKGGVNVTP
ncbi:hypothetical protein JCGZ_10491 [Jatropha curcas]|uniref:Uncharacterized protein n=1 Tax=Jatropha curcas TaxID=180498 RepID=A0A067KV81_JATCU|nr:hypothetical protein JCGZ_10491 [Jatropha curcas]